MSAILPGYTYDIFISYRQKDNKYDGWVTEFVDHLKRELEATFKEDISVYFDENPHDGLRETHIVDKSLQDKLKCLIFIPIISRTYVDPNSFAWHHEFIAFNNLAKGDPLGREVKLENGNYASRVLPVKIHDIDAEDKNYIEKVLGGIMRPVEFIYRSAGVNRPLKPDDLRTENLNHTYYRDQINKVANAVKEIISALKNPEPESSLPVAEPVVHDKPLPVKTKKFIPKFVLWIFIAVCLAIAGYYLIPALSETSADKLDKSIAVLPFENMSNDPEQEYFSDGMMQEILNHLFMIGGLKIPSGTSSMRLKGTNLSIREIAKELGVSYILEGNVSKSGKYVRIIVRLINGRNEKVLWSEDYKREMTASNLLEIQSDVSQQVAGNMKVVIVPDVKKRIEAKSTINTEAYTLYLQAWKQHLPFDMARVKLERAISLDPGFSDAYALLAYYWLLRGGFEGDIEREQVVKAAGPLIEKALELDPNSISGHTSRAIFCLYYNWDFDSVEKEFTICKQLVPSNSSLESFFSDYLLASGNYRDALLLAKKSFSNNKESLLNWVEMALAFYYNDQPDSAWAITETISRLFPDSGYSSSSLLRLTVYLEKYDKTIAYFEKFKFDKNPNKLIPFYLGQMGIAYYKTGDKNKSTVFLNELLNRTSKSPLGSPSFYAAALYATMGNKDKAIQFLQKGYSDHEVEMYWLKVEPLFKSLRGDPRFKDILGKIGFS
jgi:TolB-like protein